MSIVLERLTKRFGNQLVVDRVSLEVADHELFVLLGASGSGKSTVLRHIAGLVQADSGRILLHGQDVTAFTPQERGVGFVFQNYSIFRHMSVAENIEFGLKIRKMAAAERAKQRDHLLDLVGLAGLGGRYAHQLSGGQQQHVALARALAYQPKVLLLDEPFAALDVKIRGQLRRSLKQIQRQLGVTTILVTHDQEEAFELADRIGVMDRGQLIEVGAPEVLYARPQALFTATFLGAGMVLIRRKEADVAQFGSLRLPLPPDAPGEKGSRVQVLFRPEQVVLSQDAPPSGTQTVGQGMVIEQTFTGAQRRVRLRLPHLSGTRQIAPSAPFGEEGLLVDALQSSSETVTAESVWVSLRGWHMLSPPQPRVLLCQPSAGVPNGTALTRYLAHQLDASVMMLGIDANGENSDGLRNVLLERQREAELAADVRVRHGDPVEQIASEQAEVLYDLLVLPTSKRPNQLDPLVAQVLERMNRFWSTPVLIANNDHSRIKSVLICTAAGEPGKSDVRVGGRLARRLGAKVTLLYVTAEPGAVRPEARTHLERAAATLRALEVDGSVETRTAATPTEGILAEAREGNYDLVVLGSHGPQARSVFGRDDVTFQVASNTDHSLLVVPEEAL